MRAQGLYLGTLTPPLYEVCMIGSGALSVLEKLRLKGCVSRVFTWAPYPSPHLKHLDMSAVHPAGAAPEGARARNLSA